MGPTRNSGVLRDFVHYCHDHPDQRFWQALRNWSGARYIFVSNTAGFTLNDKCGAEVVADTFNWEGRQS